MVELYLYSKQKWCQWSSQSMRGNLNETVSMWCALKRSVISHYRLATRHESQKVPIFKMWLSILVDKGQVDISYLQWSASDESSVAGWLVLPSLSLICFSTSLERISPQQSSDTGNKLPLVMQRGTLINGWGKTDLSSPEEKLREKSPKTLLTRIIFSSRASIDMWILFCLLER